jgi:hypothetical protein
LRGKTDTNQYQNIDAKVADTSASAADGSGLTLMTVFCVRSRYMPGPFWPPLDFLEMIL